MADGIHQWTILKKYGNILKICLFGQFAKQLTAGNCGFGHIYWSNP